MTTLYSTDENSNLRIRFFEKSLENAKKLWIKVIIFDGGSNHSRFLEIIKNNREIIDIQYGTFSGLGNQTRELLKYINSQYPEKYVFRTEPEKYGLITEGDLWVLVQKVKKHPNALYISPTRDLKNSRLPRSLAFVESLVGRQVNWLLQLKDIANFQEIHDGSESEWAWSLFWPVLISPEWIGPIVRTTDLAWWSWFFPRMQAAMDGRSIYHPIAYLYSKEEIEKENQDMKKLWKFCKSVNSLSDVRYLLKMGNVTDCMILIEQSAEVTNFILKDNLAFKRLWQYNTILQGLSALINMK